MPRLCPLIGLALILARPLLASDWTPIGLSGGGAMFGPAISPADPGRLLVHCDMSGVYRSSDAGRTWTLIHADQLQASTQCRPAFHPHRAGVAYSPHSWSDRLRVTRDGGSTWSELGALGGLPVGEIGVVAGEPDRLLVGVEDQLACSRDGGVSWVRCLGPRGRVVGYHFAPLTWWVATGEGVWASNDEGATWAERTGGLPGRGLRGFSGGTRDGHTLLYCTLPCRVQNGQLAGGIYRSDDGGASWSAVRGQGLNRDTKAHDAWAMGGVVQYHQVLTTDADPRRVYAFNANTGIAPPHHSTMYRSDDAGETWRATFFPDPRWPGFNLEPNYVIAGAGQFFQSVAQAAVCARDPDHVMQLGDGDCLITTNGGVSWFNGHTAPVEPGRRDPRACFRNTGLVVTSTWNYYFDPFDRARHYIAYTDIGFARSRDAGQTWMWWGRGDGVPWINTCYELAFDPAVPGRLWGAFSNIHDIPNDNIIGGRHNSHGPGGVCVSTDHGERWQVAGKGLPVAPCTSVVLDPRSPPDNRVLYAGLFGEGVFRSRDGGRSWQAINEGLGPESNRRVTRLLLHKDGTLFALVTALRSGKTFSAEGPGLYRRREGAVRWTLINGSQPLRWPKDFAVDPADSRRVLIAAADAKDESGGLYDSRDGGDSWRRIARQCPQHFSAAFSPHHPGWIYMTLCEGAPGPALWLSKDDGGTWTPFSSLPFRNAQRVAFDPADPQVIYLTTFGASVLKGPAEPP